MIAVTGASGHLGRLAIEALLGRGAPAAEIVAAARTVNKASALAKRGVQVRHTDYDKPDTLRSAFAGVEKLLFISGTEVGRRIAQHQSIVTAARDAGVRLIAYTSVVRADSTSLTLAADHKATEEMIRASGVPFVFLRNSWYVENYTRQLAQTMERGGFAGCAGNGRVSAATRADYAEAAAVVLTTDAQENRIYELGGDEAFTMAELAAEISSQSGRTVTYLDLGFDAYVAMLVGAGLPEQVAHILADSDVGIARGDLFVDSGDLSRLIGRPTTPMARAVADGLAAIGRHPTSTTREATRRSATAAEQPRLE